MIVGKQAVKNDLEALDQKIDTKFEEAKNINVDTVSQIESGRIESGGMMDDRTIGVYHFNFKVSGSDQFGITEVGSYATNGCGLYMKTAGNSEYGILNFVNWSGDAYLSTLRSGVQQGVYKYLTTKNTITDANGFIKTA